MIEVGGFSFRSRVREEISHLNLPESVVEVLDFKPKENKILHNQVTTVRVKISYLRILGVSVPEVFERKHIVLISRTVALKHNDFFAPGKVYIITFLI